MKLGYLCGDITRLIHKNDPEIVTTAEMQEAYDAASKAVRRLVDETDIQWGMTTSANYESSLWVAFGLGAVTTAAIVAVNKIIGKITK